ncbi:MAG: hypothetical protein KDD70_05785 [Bdellovibrionales bacterium]|nr:hypothetical protein [Bdellovibrionales bacterium]
MGELDTQTALYAAKKLFADRDYDLAQQVLEEIDEQRKLDLLAQLLEERKDWWSDPWIDKIPPTLLEQVRKEEQQELHDLAHEINSEVAREIDSAIDSSCIMTLLESDPILGTEEAVRDQIVADNILEEGLTPGQAAEVRAQAWLRANLNDQFADESAHLGHHEPGEQGHQGKGHHEPEPAALEAILTEKRMSEDDLRIELNESPSLSVPHLEAQSSEELVELAE